MRVKPGRPDHSRSRILTFANPIVGRESDLSVGTYPLWIVQDLCGACLRVCFRLRGERRGCSGDRPHSLQPNCGRLFWLATLYLVWCAEPKPAVESRPATRR